LLSDYTPIASLWLSANQMTKYVAPCGADLSNNTHGFGQGFPLVFNIQLDVDLGVGRATGTTNTKHCNFSPST